MSTMFAWQFAPVVHTSGKWGPSPAPVNRPHREPFLGSRSTLTAGHVGHGKRLRCGEGWPGHWGRAGHPLHRPAATSTIAKLVVAVRFVAASIRTVAVGTVGTNPRPPFVPEKMALALRGAQGEPRTTAPLICSQRASPAAASILGDLRVVTAWSQPRISACSPNGDPAQQGPPTAQRVPPSARYPPTHGGHMLTRVLRTVRLDTIDRRSRVGWRCGGCRGT
jgi:hypothetical protein